MKKSIFKFITYVLLATVLSCSSDDKKNPESVSLDDPNPMYIKKYISDVPTSPGYSVGDFEFNNGFLISGIGACWLSGTFQYDNDGKLLSRQKNGETFTYLYDNQNRLIKQSKVASNDFISLSYNGNIITITNSYSNSSPTPYVQISEIYTDSAGKIIKTKRITPTSMYDYVIQEYQYDSRNNIIKETTKSSISGTLQPDFTLNYQYDDKKNPFYYAYKKTYKSIYYLECRSGIRNNIQTGVTPNNLTIYGNSTTYSHIYNNSGYPIKIIQTYDNGLPNLATLERTVEY